MAKKYGIRPKRAYKLRNLSGRWLKCNLILHRGGARIWDWGEYKQKKNYYETLNKHLFNINKLSTKKKIQNHCFLL